MDPILEILIALGDIDAMIKDTESPEYKEIGLTEDEDPVEKLKKLREECASKLPPNILKRYEKLKKKYGRGIAPVVGGICTNCFIHLPTSLVTRPDKNKKLETCPNCGIYVYWTK